MFFLRFLSVLLVLTAAMGCTTSTTMHAIRGEPIEGVGVREADLQIEAKGLSRCVNGDFGTIDVASGEPLVVLVHGCKGSAGRFRSLAQVYAFHGQRAVCFSYDDRESMEASAKSLGEALSVLRKNAEISQLTLIGHSQGGLIARRTMAAGFDYYADLKVRLVTVSSPFAGIAASDHCGSGLATLLTLGLNKVICYAIAGDKWNEIHPRADFILSPGELGDGVESHLKIVTDERGTCRKLTSTGACEEDDFVFSLDEQYHPPVDSEDVVDNEQVTAGHSEIVGDEEITPAKFISILQSRGLMAMTPPDRGNELARLLSILY